MEHDSIQCLIGDRVIVFIFGSAIVSAIAKRLVLGKSAAAQNVHLLPLLTPKWASIFVGNADIALDNYRALGVAANFDETRFGGSWHSDGS